MHVLEPSYRARGGERPAEQQVLERAAAHVERRTGRPLPSIRVDRRPLAATLLSPSGALAAASGATIVLPLAAGPLNGPRAAGLLAHELTHVAQHAAGVPADGASEHEARRAEEAAGGRRAVAASPVRRSVLPSADAREDVAVSLRRFARQESAAVTRATAPLIPAAAPVAAPPAPAPAPAPEPRDVQLASPDTLRPAPAPAAARHSTPVKPLDTLSRADLDELASRLYPRLRSELRSELLTDRDRVSDLADLWN